MATWKGNLDAGMVPNQVFGILEGTPQQLVLLRTRTPLTPGWCSMSAPGRWWWSCRRGR